MNQQSDLLQLDDTVRSAEGSAALPVATLRKFVRRRLQEERCELCSEPLPGDHAHLLDLAAGGLLCCCEACSILFEGGNSSKYRRIPRRGTLLADFRMTEAQWDGLQIPIKLAFFLQSTSAARVVALYPSPAGPIESLLTLDTWQQLVEENPVLTTMQPDVEALLVNRLGGAERYFVAPVDECYRLIGLIRAHWKGLSGGTEVWQEIERFFNHLKDSSRMPAGAAHA